MIIQILLLAVRNGLHIAKLCYDFLNAFSLVLFILEFLA